MQRVDEMEALLGGKIHTLPAEASQGLTMPDRDHAEISARTSILYSNVNPLEEAFRIDIKLLCEGKRRLGFRDEVYGLDTSMNIALSNRVSTQQIKDWKEDMRLVLKSFEPFFCAGSFMFPAILRLRINGTSLQRLSASMTPSKLRGYHAFAVEDAAWPALSPCGFNADSTLRMLVFGLRDSQRKRLSDFNGGMFDIRFGMVDVEVADCSTPVRLRAAGFV